MYFEGISIPKYKYKRIQSKPFRSLEIKKCLNCTFSPLYLEVNQISRTLNLESINCTTQPYIWYPAHLPLKLKIVQHNRITDIPNTYRRIYKLYNTTVHQISRTLTIESLNSTTQPYTRYPAHLP